MKQFLFISDFDGTATAQDFFLQIMYRYENDRIFDLSGKEGFELLYEVFSSVNISEDQFSKEVELIALDPNFLSTIDMVKKLGGDFLILSAGCKYYIEKKLKFEGISGVRVIANEGYYEDGGLNLLKDANSEFYCEKHGIDKKKVVQHYRKIYDTIAYAGDSVVDFDACRISDIRFAKKTLAGLLETFKLKYFSFNNFNEVNKILAERFS